MAKIKKYQAGGKTSLGMKSVKAGFDKNPGVTRADIIVAAKKEAKGGAKLKKQAAIAIAMKAAGKKPKKAQDGVFAPITVKKAKLDSVINKRKAAMDSSRAAFSRKLQEAKSKIKSSKKMMDGGKARNGKSLSPKGSNVSRRLSSYPKTIGKAKGGMNLGKCRGGCY